MRDPDPAGGSGRETGVSPAEVAKRLLARGTHRAYSLPVVVLEISSRCNCRCAMCDMWRMGNQGAELTVEDMRRHMPAFEKLGVRHAALSGGEPLLHHDPWGLCELLRAHGVRRITLLSNGLLLARHQREVVRHCDAAIVSLDGSREVHNGIRNVPQAYERLAEGVAALKAADPGFRVTARCVLQRQNYSDLPRIVEAAHELGLDGISFLAADVSSTAFNHPGGRENEGARAVAPGPGDVAAFRQAMEDTIRLHARDLESGFVAESAGKLRRLVRYAAALHGEGEFPPVRCDAPWVSAVVEADGTLRPCFFQPPLGNVHRQPLDEALNSEAAVAFRRGLDVAHDATCRTCVCSLHLGLRGRAGA